MSLNKEKFKDKFSEDWWMKIESLFGNGTIEEIYKHLKRRKREGKVIAPDSENTFRCFKETPLNNLKVVLIGMSPYHTIRNNKIVADGLLMSCSNHEKEEYLAPSLSNFYDALEEEFYNGLCVPCERPSDVKYLCE